MEDLNIFSDLCDISGGGQRGNHRTDDEAMDDDYKDGIMHALIGDNISECSLSSGRQDMCMRASTLAAVNSALGVTGDLSAAKTATDCDSERCVLEKVIQVGNPQLVQLARAEIKSNFKISGPTDSALLNNVNIDDTMQQWAKRWPDFYPYHFHMLNYASYSYDQGRILNHPDTLATILFDDLYAKGFRTCGCVINTDTYQGPGQHWMALFADARMDGNKHADKSKPIEWSVEFFNSSGNSPAPEWINWMEKTRILMENIVAAQGLPISVRVVKASSIRHQKSRTECGVYSLFYIWARLNGVPYEYFATNRIPDQLMFEFRQHLFNDPTRKELRKFKWSEYKSTAKIKWGE